MERQTMMECVAEEAAYLIAVRKQEGDGEGGKRE
jgi:hypothetical protein